MLDLLKLKTFLVVAATSSFTRAGAELGYSQSNVTTHIQNLERELGAPLFDRLRGKVILTEIGRQMHDFFLYMQITVRLTNLDSYAQSGNAVDAASTA